MRFMPIQGAVRRGWPGQLLWLDRAADTLEQLKLCYVAQRTATLRRL